MPITELCDDGGSPLILGVHPGLAVVSASASARAQVCEALTARPGLVIIDASALEQRMVHEQAGLDRLHEEVVERQTARRNNAQDALGRAAVAVAEAEQLLHGANSESARLDALETALAVAQSEHDAAASTEADILQRVSDVLRRRQRLAHHRRDAGAALAHLRTSTDRTSTDRTSTGGRPREEVRQQVADIEAALSRAEAEQAAVEHQLEAALTAARDARLAAVAALDQADARIRAMVPPDVTAAWPPGPPLPTCLADHRVRLGAAIHSAEARLEQAKEAHEAAALQAQHQERVLAQFAAQTSPLDRAKVIEDWLSPHGPLAAPAELLLIDEAFAGPDLDVACAALELLSAHRSLQTVYLSEHPAVLSWAIGLPRMTGGIAGLGHRTSTSTSTSTSASASTTFR